MVLYTCWPNPITPVLAVVIIGSRQLGLAVLMHEGRIGSSFCGPVSRSARASPWKGRAERPTSARAAAPDTARWSHGPDRHAAACAGDGDGAGGFPGALLDELSPRAPPAGLRAVLEAPRGARAAPGQGLRLPHGSRLGLRRRARPSRRRPYRSIHLTRHPPSGRIGAVA